MTRSFVIGDIHGGLKALVQILELVNLNPSDQLIFLGDYVDGWSESPQVLDFLIDLDQNQKCVFMKGNHDELLLEWLLGSKKNKMWANYGGEATVLAYQTVSDSTKKKHIEFLKSLNNYYLNDHNQLFVHAGFTNLNGVAYEYFPKMLYWERTLWEMALALDKNMKTSDLQYPKRLLLYKEIFIGHTPVSKIEEITPVNRANVWNVDTGAAYKGPLTIMDVETKQFWQSDLLPNLYSDEIGRN